MREWMNYLKEKIDQGKQDAFVWYSVASRWFTMGNILLYVASCIIAGGMVGPVRYVEFLYHCCHFGRPAQVAQVVTPEKALGPIEQPDARKSHAPPKLDIDGSF
jgi:hypothetical protein